jgi:hypothetical protein
MNAWLIKIELRRYKASLPCMSSHHRQALQQPSNYTHLKMHFTKSLLISFLGLGATVLAGVETSANNQQYDFAVCDRVNHWSDMPGLVFYDIYLAQD